MRLHTIDTGRCCAAAAALLLLVAPVEAQVTPAPPAATAAPATVARAADVASIDAIIAAIYDVISGPAGAARDWDRFRSLFAAGARLIPTGKTPEGTPRIRVGDVEAYIATSGPALVKSGFFEREIGRQTERFGNIAHVFSTYDSRRAATDAAPFARGINSIQLYFDGARWWVVTILWDSEREGNPIPAGYLAPRG